MDSGTPKLILLEPGGARREVALTKFPFSIGRQGGNDLVLGDNRISRQHAILRLEDGHCLVEDPGSKHGVFVNNERITGRRALKNDDRIDFGLAGSYSLLFCTEESGLRKLLERVETPAAVPATSRELHNLNVLLEVGRMLHAGLSLEEVLASVLDASLRVTKTERGFILLRGAKGELEFHAGRDKGKRSLAASDFAGSASVIDEALKSQQDFIVTNSLDDTRVRDRASVVGLDLRTIICLPLRQVTRSTGMETTATPTVEVLGVLYLDSHYTSEPFEETDRQILRALAIEAAGVIENARLFTAAKAKEKIDQELAIARQIQQLFLPTLAGAYGFFRVAGVNIPCQEVGGDYFDLIEMSDRRFAVVIADVSGKGISAAILTSMLQGALTALVELGQTVDAAARHLNRYLRRHAALSKYATFFCGVLYPDGRFQYVNAGHPPPLVVSPDRQPEALMADCLPIGLFDEAEYAPSQIKFQPGQAMVLYTDGFSEAANSAGDIYGVERLQQLLWNERAAAPDDMSEAILDDVRAFTGNTPQGDDMTLLILRYDGTAQN